VMRAGSSSTWLGGDTATVRDLVAELDADWEVRESHGVGIDPVTLVAIIAVPFSAFLVKFLEVRRWTAIKL
jgi:hypothetical protein